MLALNLDKKNTLASISVNVFSRLEIAWLHKLAKWKFFFVFGFKKLKTQANNFDFIHFNVQQSGVLMFYLKKYIK